MKHSALEMTLLLDYYGELLTEKQKTCFDLYYNQDLSLGEIAEEAGISRQGVHDSLARAEAVLLAYIRAVCPLAAKTWAMPLPMVPAPKIATFIIIFLLLCSQ